MEAGGGGVELPDSYVFGYFECGEWTHFVAELCAFPSWSVFYPPISVSQGWHTDVRVW